MIHNLRTAVSLGGLLGSCHGLGHGNALLGASKFGLRRRRTTAPAALGPHTVRHASHGNVAARWQVCLPGAG
jgi:hypothetical protein